MLGLRFFSYWRRFWPKIGNEVSVVCLFSFVMAINDSVFALFAKPGFYGISGYIAALGRDGLDADVVGVLSIAEIALVIVSGLIVIRAMRL